MGTCLLKTETTDRLDTRDIIIKIRRGDRHLRDKFISDHKAYIIKTVSKLTGNFIEVQNSEEYSIGLMAFNETIDSFDLMKPVNFFFFAERVIKNRIIDYARSRRKYLKFIPFTCFEKEDGFEEKYLVCEEDRQFEGIELREELAFIRNKLREYGISLESLAASSPKHTDARQNAIKVARILAENGELYRKLVETKKIPINELLKCVDVHKRTIERNRGFIIAVCLILKNELNLINGIL